MMGAMPLGAIVSNTGWRICPIDCWNQENKLDIHFEKAWNGGGGIQTQLMEFAF